MGYAHLRLSEHTCKSARNVICDNFSTSLELTRALSLKKLSLVSTVRKNRMETQKEMRNFEDKELHGSKFHCTHDGIQLVLCKTMKTKMYMCFLVSILLQMRPTVKKRILK